MSEASSAVLVGHEGRKQSLPHIPFAARARAERVAAEKAARTLAEAIDAARKAARSMRALRPTIGAYPAEVRGDVEDRIDAMLDVLASFDSVLCGEEDADGH